MLTKKLRVIGAESLAFNDEKIELQGEDFNLKIRINRERDNELFRKLIDCMRDKELIEFREIERFILDERDGELI